MRQLKHLKTVGILVLLIFLVLYPLVLSPSPGATNVGVYVLLYTGAAVAWNLFAGFTGYINLGSATYLGIGGYAMAILCRSFHLEGGYTPFLLLPLAGIIAALCAVPLGWLALRVRRYAFMVLTLAMLSIGQYLAYNLRGLTNGAAGIFLPNPPWDAYFFDVPFYFAALALFLLAVGLAWWVRSSKFGLGLLALRDDEERVRSLGIKTEQYKLMAYMLSSFFIGMTGALSAYYIGTIYPEQGFSPSFDVILALMAFFGGVGTVIGPIVGGLIVVPLQQFLALQLGATPLEPILYGGLLLGVILFLPEGIIPSLRSRSMRLARHEAENTTPAEPAAELDVPQTVGEDLLPNRGP